MTRTTRLLAATVAATILTLGLAAQPAAASDPIPTQRQAIPVHCTEALQIRSVRHHNVTYLYRADGTCQIIIRPYLRPCHKRAATVIVVHRRGHRTCRR